MVEQFDELVKLMQEGRGLKDEGKPVLADSHFDYWVHRVTEYLVKNFPPRLALEWQSLPESPLVHGGHYYDDIASWGGFRDAVSARLQWLSKLPIEPAPNGASPAFVTHLDYLDSDLKARCLPIINANPDDPKVWDSAVRTAGVVLEERLRTIGRIKDGSVGRELVNKIFGKAGTLASEFTLESERDGYRDLFAGVVGAFRNPSAHRLIDPNPHEGGAYIVFVNLLLKHLEKFVQPGPTNRDAFLAACSDGAAPFFAEVLDEAAKRKLSVSFGGKGFTVRAGNRACFFYCFPPGANDRPASEIEIVLDRIAKSEAALNDEMRVRFLEVEGTKATGAYTIRLRVIKASIPQARELFQRALQFMERQR